MTLEEQEPSHTAAISNEPHQSEVQELRELFAMLLNKLLLSLLLTIDVHSGVSAATGRVTYTMSAYMATVRPEGIPSTGSVASFARDCRQ